MRRKQNLKQLATLSDPRPYVLKQCDCAFDQDEDGDTSVQWCNLHAAAPALLETVKQFVEAYKQRDEYGADIVTDALDVIRHAEGRHA